ncbi:MULTISPECIES: hypothetical protein [Pseudomonadaceae]|uniref:hypothetical protein n=1 Tax=Pseudomonadaceae TaxID=135621 RepID=UPI00244D6681|nr:hypothetical protein [Pseudomonas chengduensis]MDH1869224.1 hypothetical protein [Pseudomonas chengduensis]
MELPYVTIAISITSVLISLASVTFAMNSWHRTNRPIISARITTAVGGEVNTALNIVVENTGNRPAKSIKLIAKRSDVLGAMREKSQIVPIDAEHCFFEHKIIPVLANGKAASNAFGSIGEDGEWEAGAKIPLEIEYFSFEGKRYTEEMALLLVDDAGFAQTFWGTPAPS